MAGERTLPGIGLTGFWDQGDDTWKAGADENWLKLSVLCQAIAISLVAATPGAPANGDVHLFTAAHPTQPNKVAVRDNGAWVYFTPSEGWEFYNLADNLMYQFDGAAWSVMASGGGATAFAGLTDVDMTGIADGDIPVWDAGAGKFLPGAGGGGGGGSGAPWYFDPPLAANFTRLSGDATLPVLSDHAGAGLLVDFGNSVGGDKTRGAWMPIPNPNANWTIVCRYSWNVPKSNYLYGGFSLRDSAHGRFLTMGPIEDGGGDFTVRHFNTLGGTAANVCGIGTRKNWEFARVDYDVVAETLTYYASTDGAAWVLLGSNSRTVYYVNRLDQMGLALTMNNGGGVRCWMSCDMLTVNP